MSVCVHLSVFIYSTHFYNKYRNLNIKATQDSTPAQTQQSVYVTQTQITCENQKIMSLVVFWSHPSFRRRQSLI